MSNSTHPGAPAVPGEAEPLFAGAIRDGGLVVAALFRCGTCNTLTVTEPGEICPSCTPPTTTTRTRARRSRPTKKSGKGEAR